MLTEPKIRKRNIDSPSVWRGLQDFSTRDASAGGLYLKFNYREFLQSPIAFEKVYFSHENCRKLEYKIEGVSRKHSQATVLYES